MAMSGPTDPASSSRSEEEVQCRRIAELLGDYLEGTLPKRTAELIEWHIDGCGPCIAFINTYRGTVNATRMLRAVEIPPELKTRLVRVLQNKAAE
jgi:epoxyqueuosine reductase QueG